MVMYGQSSVIHSAEMPGVCACVRVRVRVCVLRLNLTKPSFGNIWGCLHLEEQFIK